MHFFRSNHITKAIMDTAGHSAAGTCRSELESALRGDVGRTVSRHVPLALPRSVQPSEFIRSVMFRSRQHCFSEFVWGKNTALYFDPQIAGGKVSAAWRACELLEW